jgi:hypothetical protein
MKMIPPGIPPRCGGGGIEVVSSRYLPLDGGGKIQVIFIPAGILPSTGARVGVSWFDRNER